MRRVALLFLLSACGVDASGTVQSECPSRAEFDAVSPLLEERCGTLDCHGSPARSLRVYGTGGMRLFRDPGSFDPGTSAYPDASPTSDAERSATRRSLCALEPEAMAAVRAGDVDAGELSLLGKANGDEHHKGGVLFHPGDGAERCLQSWIEGAVDLGACASALEARSP